MAFLRVRAVHNAERGMPGGMPTEFHTIITRGIRLNFVFTASKWLRDIVK